MAVGVGHTPLPRPNVLHQTHPRHADRGVQARGPHWQDLPSLRGNVPAPTCAARANTSNKYIFYQNIFLKKPK